MNRCFLMLIVSLACCSTSLIAKPSKLKQSSRSLASNQATTRTKASKQLKAAGYDAIAHILPLMHSDNARTKQLASEIYSWVMLGMNDKLPKDIRKQLYHFNQLSEKELKQLIKDLKNSHLKPAVTLAALHSRILDSSRFNSMDRIRLIEGSKDALVHVSGQMDTTLQSYDPRILRVETKAIIIDELQQRKAKNLDQDYKNWLALDPLLRIHLDHHAVLLEIARLNKLGRQQELIQFYQDLVSPRAKTKVRGYIKQKMKTELLFDLDSMSMEHSLTFLEIIFTQEQAGEHLLTYTRLLTKHPQLKAKLSKRLLPLEVHRLIENASYSEAFQLTCSINNTRLMKRISEIYQKSINITTKGLPPLPKKVENNLSFWLDAMYPSSARHTDKEVIESMQKLLQSLQSSNEENRKAWLILLENEFQYHYAWIAALQGNLDGALHDFARKNDKYGINQIGLVLYKNEGFSKQINAKNHNTETLRVLVFAPWRTYEKDLNVLIKSNQLSIQWVKEHPTLLTNGDKRIIRHITATREWLSNEHLKSIKNFSESQPRHTRESWILIQLMEITPNVKVSDLFSNPEIPTTFLRAMISQSVEIKHPSPQVANNLDKIWACCQDRKEQYSGSISYEARLFAYDLWKNKHTNLAYKIMQHAFWDDDDLTERSLGLFPSMALTLGKIDQALSYSETRDKKHSRYGIKLAYLHRAAGDLEQASKWIAPFPKSKLARILATEQQDWKKVMSSYQSLKKSIKENHHTAYKVWYATLTENHQSAQQNYRYLKRPSPWLTLAVKEIKARSSLYSTRYYHSYNNPLKSLAMDTYLINHCEERLLFTIESKKVVPYEVMKTYFDYINHLPNKKLAIQIAYHLGQLPLCDSQIHSKRESTVWKHKIKAIAVLHKLQAHEQRDKIIQLTFAKNPNFQFIPGMVQREFFQIFFPRQYDFHPTWIKLVQLETADLSVTERFQFLVKLAEKKDRVAFAKTMIQAAKKHQDKLTPNHNRNLYYYFSRYLGQPSIKLDDLNKLEGSIFDHIKLQYIKPPTTRSTPIDKNKRIFHANPASNTDPRNKKFETKNGIARVKQLWDLGQQKEAKMLMQAITMRLILKNSDSEPLTISSYRSRMSSSYRSEVIALIGFTLLEFSDELIGNSERAIINLTAADIYSIEEKYKWAAEIALERKNYQLALFYYHLYADALVTGSYTEVLPLLSRFYALKAIASAQSGDTDLIISHSNKRRSIAPYDLSLTPDLLKILKKKGNTKAIKALHQQTTQYWNTKLLRLPGYPPYQKALAAWNKLVKDFL